MHDVKVIGLFGLIGLLGLLALWWPIPKGQPGGLIRLLGLGGLLGVAGFWNPWLGACGAIGALGIWNHPVTILRRLALLALGTPVGLVLGLILRVTS